MKDSCPLWYKKTSCQTSCPLAGRISAPHPQPQQMVQTQSPCKGQVSMSPTGQPALWNPPPQEFQTLGTHSLTAVLVPLGASAGIHPMQERLGRAPVSQLGL